jgi:hypothetical protein
MDGTGGEGGRSTIKGGRGRMEAVTRNNYCRRVAHTLVAYDKEFMERVLIHGVPPVLVDVSAPRFPLIREFTFSAEPSWPLHKVFMIYEATARMLMYEFDAAIGSCFLQAKMAVIETPYVDAKGKTAMVDGGVHPRTGAPLPAQPLIKYETVETEYMKRRKADLSVKRTRDEYQALMWTSDNDFFNDALQGKLKEWTRLPPVLAEGSSRDAGRLSYAERKRFHYDAFLAFQRFLLDHTSASDLLEANPDQSVIYRLRCFEFLIEKLKLISSWAWAFRLHGHVVSAATRFNCMECSVASASPGFLTESLDFVDGPEDEREAVWIWREYQVRIDKDIAIEDARVAAATADEAVVGSLERLALHPRPDELPPAPPAEPPSRAKRAIAATGNSHFNVGEELDALRSGGKRLEA